MTQECLYGTIGTAYIGITGYTEYETHGTTRPHASTHVGATAGAGVGASRTTVVVVWVAGAVAVAGVVVVVVVVVFPAG